MIATRARDHLNMNERPNIDKQQIERIQGVPRQKRIIGKTAPARMTKYGHPSKNTSFIKIFLTRLFQTRCVVGADRELHSGTPGAFKDRRSCRLPPVVGAWRPSICFLFDTSPLPRSFLMAHVVAEPCCDCKHTDCVVVCPVECFHEGPRMLYIHPDECIDCEACVPECPEEAIYHEDRLPADWAPFRDLNATMARQTPLVS